MQLINHKNQGLTICQKFFIEKSIELLYIGSIDSYRVKLHNPKSILKEVKYCLEDFQVGRIKHFHSIKAKEKDKKAIIEEAISLIKEEPNYLIFNSISINYLEQLLTHANEFNYKKIISAIDILLDENNDYLSNVIDGLQLLINANQTPLPDLQKIDTSLNILYSELIGEGFSKGFLHKLVYGIFRNSLIPGNNFDDHFANFRIRLLTNKTPHQVAFRVDSSQKVIDSISAIPNSELALSDNLSEVQLSGWSAEELNAFNAPGAHRKFITLNVIEQDYLSALKKARSILSEYLDVINLGLSDEFLQIHHRALVIDMRSPQRGQFQHNTNILDGLYRVEKGHYQDFARKMPSILNNNNLQQETKEKLKSAIRYLRLGNQSTEVEHKFINYWIGLEYLFSNYESQNTINRIKDHFINAHALAYVKRNAYSFKKDFEKIPLQYRTTVPSYTTDSSCLSQASFYQEVGTSLLQSFPLLAYRALKLHKWFFPIGKAPNAADYIKRHRANLEIHFTRIYRLRNEIIHDAATNTNNEQIASNLRYYLTFILNELIDFFSNNPPDRIKYIEDYFTLSEIEIGNVEFAGYPLDMMLNTDCSIEFISG
jgi:hypothetical protein